jgi:acetyl-CoA acetyltransferase
LRKAAIVSPLRTPIGRFLGSLAPVPAERLAAHIISALVERTGIDPARIDDVVFAQSYANSEAPCIGRWAALAAGLPIEVPGMQLDRRCGGGLQSIAMASMMVETGACDIVLAGGVESMSNIEYYTTSMRGGARAASVLPTQASIGCPATSISALKGWPKCSARGSPPGRWPARTIAVKPEFVMFLPCQPSVGWARNAPRQSVYGGHE